MKIRSFSWPLSDFATENHSFASWYACCSFSISWRARCDALLVTRTRYLPHRSAICPACGSVLRYALEVRHALAEVFEMARFGDGVGQEQLEAEKGSGNRNTPEYRRWVQASLSQIQGIGCNTRRAILAFQRWANLDRHRSMPIRRNFHPWRPDQ
jgi:hypothetical protein